MSYFQLNHSWTSIPDSAVQYLEVLKSVEQTHFIVILGAALLKHLSETNKSEIAKGYVVITKKL